MRATRKPILWFTAFLLCSAWAAIGAGGATPVSVTQTVVGVTTFDTTGCGSLVSGRTDFGSLLPGGNAVTRLDCTVDFGASNATSSLRAFQTDGGGAAMYKPASGAVDTGFSGDGIQSTTGITGVEDSVVDGSGNVYIVGRRNNNMAVAKYLANGNLDTTWGVSSGVTEINLSLPYNCADIPGDIEMDASGRLLIGGESRTYYAWFGDYCVGTGPFSFTPHITQYASITRLTAGGGFDTSFDGDGRQFFSGGSAASASTTGTRFMKILALPDGSVLAIGSTHDLAIDDDDALVVKYSSTGTQQAMWRRDMSTISGTPNAFDDRLFAADVRPDGTVLVGGSYYWNPSSSSMAVVRRLTIGSSSITDDASFGGSGGQPAGQAPILTAVGVVRRLIALANGGFIVASASGSGTFINQMQASGAADASFDSDGIVSIAGNQNTDVGMIRRENGSFIVTSSTIDAGGDVDWRLNGLTSTGAPDTTFSGDGVQIYEPTTNSDALTSVTAGPDGTIVAVGNHDTIGGILNLGTTTIGDYSSPTRDWDAGTNTFGACLASVTNATAVWGSTGSCTDSDSDPWRAIARTSAGGTAQIATGAAYQSSNTARLRFGLRSAASQAPGSYIAPITFEVVAVS